MKHAAPLLGAFGFCVGLVAAALPGCSLDLHCDGAPPPPDFVDGKTYAFEHVTDESRPSDWPAEGTASFDGTLLHLDYEAASGPVRVTFQRGTEPGASGGQGGQASTGGSSGLGGGGLGGGGTAGN